MKTSLIWGAVGIVFVYVLPALAVERSVPLPYDYSRSIQQVYVPSCSGSQYVAVSGTRFVCRDFPTVGWGFVAEGHMPQKTSEGGGLAGKRQIRLLNTVRVNTISATLLSNVFTLPVGTYEIEWDSPGYRVYGHRADIYYQASSSLACAGTPEYSHNSDQTASNRSMGYCKLSINSPTSFYISHYTEGGLPGGTLGAWTNAGGDEIYSRLRVRKLE